jgi:hypothetical protein
MCARQSVIEVLRYISLAIGALDLAYRYFVVDVAVKNEKRK